MKRRRRARRRTVGPFHEIQLDLTIDEVMADLDAGWSAQSKDDRETDRSKRRAA